MLSWLAYQQIEEQSELGDARMKNLKMQCVALEADNENPIHCPFCGIKIARGANEEEMGEWIVGHCEHLLFAAVDGGDGYEYRSKRFDDALEAVMSKKTDEERDEFIDDNIEEVASIIEIPNAFMFQSSMRPPAALTSYVGFAPI